MDFALLGPLAVTNNGSTVELTGPKRRALLILLALNAGTPMSRDRIVEALWPDPQTGREESTLRVHISHLRDEIEPARNGEPKLILTKGSAYMLSEEGVETDIARFSNLAREGRELLQTEPEEAVERLNEALGLWRGRPLEDVEYEEFAQDDIRRLELARIEAIEDRAEAMVELGRDAAAIEDLESLVRGDPTRERPVRLLMLALYRVGRHSDSLRAARRHTRELSEQGLEPSPRLTALEEQILQHDSDLLPEGVVSPGDIGPGRSIRGYELREEAGTGSIGIVYQAFQSSVGREVALKMVHPDLSGTSEFTRRFAKEARLVAGLEHPHIVPLHDFWRDPTGAFLVMRWMEGGSLVERMGQPWDENDLVRVFGQLSDALGYAHSAGVVHRDVKPANALFDRSGNAYLSDFGLAVTGIDTGIQPQARPSSVEAPYAPPEFMAGEGPTVASDVFGLGVLLAEAASGRPFDDAGALIEGELGEVVTVATNPNPADRYPDMAAFRSALIEAVGPITVPAPRRVRRNPYKGLTAFEEGDRADFYGRDGMIETLVGKVGSNGLTTIIGASGSGKSSVVMAGLVPELRAGALPGSDEWSVVYMVPGNDPFGEFHTSLRTVAVAEPSNAPEEGARELRNAFTAALEGPKSRAVLVVDQFEELFSSDADDATAQKFLDNLIDLAVDPSGRFRVVLTLRADFSDKPLSNPHFGELMSRASVLVAPMRPEQIEDVIRKPAARVGVQVEPGLVAEIVRDIASASAFLPLLQYVLSELFERRNEDRLTVQSYRSLGGVQGVLERRAESTYAALGSGAQKACRQLFLRMVHVGDHGEATRRRLPLTELSGLGARSDVDEALSAFSAARILTYDRDPVTRTPTVEVAHETVIDRWTRFRVWVDEARSDLLAHRRLAAATSAWIESGEDATYLLTGGPLATSMDLAHGDRISLNEDESRFVQESERVESERQRQTEAVEHRSKRRLVIGIGTGVIALLVGVLAVFAFVQRQRANDLAAQQARQSTARDLAADSVANLDSADPDLSLLLAIEGAQQSLDAGEEVLPEVVEALHRAVINPRPSLILDGASSRLGGQIIAYSRGGVHLAMVSRDGGVVVVDPDEGKIVGRIPAVAEPAFGVDFHFTGSRVLTVHADGVRQWNWQAESLHSEHLSDGEASAAGYSPDGRLFAIGHNDGTIQIVHSSSGETVARFDGHETRVSAIDFDRTGTRLVSGGNDASTRVWDVESGRLVTEARTSTIIQPIEHLAWHPSLPAVVVTTKQAETFIFDAVTGERLNSFGNGQHFNSAIAFESTGSLMVAAGGDGVARIYGTLVGGEAAIELPTGGVPLRDAEFEPGGLTVATAGVDGKVRIWTDILGSELPIRVTNYLYPRLTASADGSRYILGSSQLWLGIPSYVPATIEVIDTATDETLLSRPIIRGKNGLGRFAISADGSLAAFPGPSGNIEVVGVDTGATLVIPGSADSIAALAFNSDGSQLATGSFGGPITIWDTSTGKRVKTLDGHGDREPLNRSAPKVQEPGVSVALTTKRVNDVRWLPGDDVLVSAGYDGTVRVWDTATGEGRVVHTSEYEVFSVVHTAGAASLVAVDRTGAIVEIDIETAEVVRELESISAAVTLVMSADGSLLAGGAVIWDVNQGRIVRRLQGSLYALTDAAFIEEGQILTSSGEGMIRRYLLDPIALVDLARSETSRSLTDQECTRYLGTDNC